MRWDVCREGTDLVLGYAYLDSAVIKSVLFPTSVGYPLANVPKQTFNFFLTHRLFARFRGGLGGNYVASRTASSTVPYVPTSFGPATVVCGWLRALRCDGNDLLSGAFYGDEAGSGVLGVQRDGKAADDGSH